MTVGSGSVDCIHVYQGWQLARTTYTPPSNDDTKDDLLIVSRETISCICGL